jgi:hypothetical protein
LDVSASLRRWVAAHPKIDASEAFDSLLSEAADAWNRESYPLWGIPQPQRFDGVITTLTCGDFEDSHPVIVQGQTFVRPDGAGGQTAGYRRLEPESGGILYIRGDWDIRFYPLGGMVGGLILPNPVGYVESVTRELTANPSAMAAVRAWRQADMERNVALKRAASGDSAQYAPSNWARPSLRDLLVGVFVAVERNTPNVAGPNNLRIVASCGRLSSTVESDPWPTCPKTESVPKGKTASDAVNPK